MCIESEGIVISIELTSFGALSVVDHLTNNGEISRNIDGFHGTKQLLVHLHSCIIPYMPCASS